MITDGRRVWIVEELCGGRWVPTDTNFFTRREARKFVQVFYLGNYRVVSYTPTPGARA